MKKSLMILIMAGTLLTACKPSAEKTATARQTLPADSTAVIGTADLPDSVAISNSLIGFFNWYDKHADSLARIRFVDEQKEHLELDEPLLQRYLSVLGSSGLVSTELLDNETRFYKACEKAWQSEKKDEIPTGLSADRFYCAQDFIAPYSSGKVTSEVNGDRATATLTLTGEMGEKSQFRFDMKKEYGKWLLARLGCDMGVKY